MGRATNRPRKPASSGRRPKVGDLVRFVLGTREVTAPVVEDRGDLGVGGRQIVSVALRTHEGDVEVFEVGAHEVTLDTNEESGGVNGQHASGLAQGTNVVVLDPDVAAVFKDSERVNQALRAVIDVEGRTKTRGRTRRTKRTSR